MRVINVTNMVLVSICLIVLASCGHDPEPGPGPGPGPGPIPDKTFSLKFKQLDVSGEILPGAKVTVAEAKAVISTEVNKLEQ